LTESIYHLLMDRTGSVPPLTDYSQVFVHGDAAQEAAGMSLIAESALAELRSDPSEDWIFSHELAHQWFASLITCADFADFWLNEGFATFFVGIFKEHRFGRSAYEQEVGRWRESSARVHAQG
jgi:aminopeptidase N